MAEVMNRAAGTNAVRDIIIKPMCELYLPSPHSRHNAPACSCSHAARRISGVEGETSGLLAAT
jgi:hypothetical protein